MKAVLESIPVADALTLRVLDLTLDAFSGPLHAHPLLELTWIERGAGLRFVGDSVEPFAEGDLVLVAPGAAHTWWSSGEQPRPVKARVMQLRPTSLLTALPEWRASIDALLQEPASAWRLHGELAGFVKAGLLHLAQAQGLEQLGVALALLGRIARARPGEERTPIGLQAPRLADAGGLQERRVDALLGWVRAHLDRDITVAEASQQLHVSPLAFSRTFKRLVGKTFTDYVNDLRIAEAMLMLRGTDLAITAVAGACGFPTLSNFNAQFRRRAGMSPREYRKAGTRPSCAPVKAGQGPTPGA